MGPQTNSNNFFGIAVSQPGINVNQASPSQMLYTNDYSTTTWRDSNGTISLQEGLLSNGNYGLSAGGGSVVLDSVGFKYSDTSNIRAFMGSNTTLGDGFYVSKPGYDADTASGDNLIFNSNQNVFKIIDKLSGNLPSFSISNSTQGYTSVSISHNQDFIPIVNVYLSGQMLYMSGGLQQSNDSFIPVPFFQTGTHNSYSFPDSSGAYYIDAFSAIYSVTSTDVIVALSYNAGSITDTFPEIPVTIFVLQESV